MFLISNMTTKLTVISVACVIFLLDSTAVVCLVLSSLGRLLISVAEV